MVIGWYACDKDVDEVRCMGCMGCYVVFGRRGEGSAGAGGHWAARELPHVATVHETGSKKVMDMIGSA
jgi:hypothetical protein